MTPRLRYGRSTRLFPTSSRPQRDDAARVARIDDVVDEAPAGDLVDVDVLLDHRRRLPCFTSGGGSASPKSFFAAMPTMPSAPITLISAVGQPTMRSGS